MRYKTPRATPEKIVENAKARRARWSQNNRQRELEMKRNYASSERGKQLHNNLRNKKRRSDPDRQRYENVRFRLSRETGIAISILPVELVEAKVMQLKVRSLTRKQPKAHLCLLENDHDPS